MHKIKKYRSAATPRPVQMLAPHWSAGYEGTYGPTLEVSQAQRVVYFFLSIYVNKARINIPVPSIKLSA